MIPSEASIIEFDIKYDRFFGESSRNITLEEKDNVINEALLLYVSNKAQIAETSSKVRRELRVLEEKEVPLGKAIAKERSHDIFKLPEYVKVLRHKADINKEGCGLKRDIPVLIYQSDDLNNARKSPYWKSSYEWEHILADEGSKGLYLWHEGEFKTESVTIDYIRKPKRFMAASLSDKGYYINSIGQKVTKNQGIELDQFAHNNILDIAALIAKSNVGDVPDFQQKLNEILTKEKIYL